MAKSRAKKLREKKVREGMRILVKNEEFMFYQI